MTTWKSEKLGRLVSFSSGGTPSKKNDSYWNGDIPWVSAKTMKSDRIGTSELYITEEGLANGSKLAEIGSLLLLVRGSGLFKGIPVCYVVSPVAYNQDVKCINSRSEVENEYIYYWLKANSDYLRVKLEVTGIGAGKFDTKFLSELDVVYPEQEIRRKIIDFANNLTDKIQVNEAINRNLMDQAQAYYSELFIENASENWQEGTLSDVGTVVAGGTPSKAKEEYYTEHGIAWITPKDLSLDKSVFVSHGKNDISELGYEKSSATKMPEGAVLFSSRAPIGYIAIAANEVTTNQGFKSVVPKENVGTAYIYFLLRQLLPTIENMASGSTFKEISGSSMKIVPTIVPDNETLSKFDEFCQPLMKQVQKLEQESKKLVILRDSLLPKLMSGEVDVSDLEI